MQAYEKGQKQPYNHYGTDMSKTQIFHVSIVKIFAKFTILQISTSSSQLQLSNPRDRARLIFKGNVKTKAWERFV